MNNKGQHHIVVVEAYEGLIEFVTDEREDRKSSQGLGLPLEEIAESLDCQITVLCWDEWTRYELSYGSPFTWVSTPLTRLVAPHEYGAKDESLCSTFSSPRIKRASIPARNPEHWLLFDETGLNPKSAGFNKEYDIAFFISYCLASELKALNRLDPFHIVLLPMWGGPGYVCQMERATNADNRLDVPFVVVVTDTSANRQRGNQEAVWSRPSIVRRQMEDLSLALADLPLVFGARGRKIALAGRLPGASPPLLAPRRVAQEVVSDVDTWAKRTYSAESPKQLFLYEPQQPASGTLSALDAIDRLRDRGSRLKRPLICSGPPMVFAPMAPQSFEEYWSSRGFVRELVRDRQWAWQIERPILEGVFPIRLYPSCFEYLPNVWSELARGSYVLLSPAAAEGLGLDENVASDSSLTEDPTPEALADAITYVTGANTLELDRIRRKLCERVVESCTSPKRSRLIKQIAEALKSICVSSPPQQNLGRVARLLLDRGKSLRDIDSAPPPSFPAVADDSAKPDTLSVVVTCYEMGQMLGEAVRSVWAADRCPDELLLIDDGSFGEETTNMIQELQREAREQELPLRIIRQHNRGLAAARNAGLEAAMGKFISFLDGDDIIEPPFYRLALKLLENYPELGGVGAWSFCFRPEDTTRGFWNAPQPELPFLFTENCVFIPCMVRTALLKQLGGNDTCMRYNYEDWELSCRMLASGWPILVIPAYMQWYRIRQDSMLRTMTENQLMRELSLSKHREIVSRFAAEIVLLTEDRLKR